MEDVQIWLGLNGQRFGPYALALVQRWHQQGMLDNGSLCWREGMSEWSPLETFLRENVAAASFNEPPSFEVPPPGLAPRASVAVAVAVAVAARDTAPVAPSLHWGLVLLFGVLTLGIFILVWMFIQSTWVKKIDPASRATTYLAIGLVVGLSGAFAGPDSQLYYVLQLIDVAFVVIGYFSMSASLKRFGIERGLPMAIGGITLFFFTTFYLQGQLTRLANWQRTGVVEEAPKSIFWTLYAVVFVLFAMVAVVALQMFH